MGNSSRPRSEPSKQRRKNPLYITSIVVLSVIIAFLFAVLVSKVPTKLDSLLAKDAKENITDEKELLRVLKGGINSSENDRPTVLASTGFKQPEPEDEYHVSPQMYESNIRYLFENGYSTVTLKDFARSVKNGQRLSSKTALIYSDTTSNWFYNIAFPILKKYKFTATIGVETNLVNTPGHLNVTQLAELERYGMEIASHSISHPDLATVDEERLKSEVTDSKHKLEAWGLDVETFIYPFGSYNDKVIRAVKDAGYIAARTTGGTNLNNGGGYAGYNKDLLYEIRAGLPINTNTFDDFKKYVLNDHIELEAVSSAYMKQSNSSVRRFAGEKSNDLKNDSYASVGLANPGDALQLSLDVPEAGAYNLDFRVKTGSSESGGRPNSSEREYQYVINGRSYTVENGTVRTSGPYQNESTDDRIVWGHQHLNNVDLKKGSNEIVVVALAPWIILDCLSVKACDGSHGIEPQMLASIDYDGIFGESSNLSKGIVQTGVFLAMHGFEHQNPRSGEFNNEFMGLSYQEISDRVAKSNRIFHEAHLKPAMLIPPGGKADDLLYKIAAQNNLTILDSSMFEGTWMWRDMKSFNDPRYAEAVKEFKKRQPRGILIHMQDYNKYTERIVESYINSRSALITLRVDDVNPQTRAEDLQALLRLQKLHKNQINLVLGVTPRFYKKDSVAFGTIFEILWVFFLFSVVFTRIFFACLATADRLKNRQQPGREVVSLANGGGLPKVSIVIPMFNEGQSAIQAIRSAQNQSYPGPTEIIVMDDGSHDDTFEIIKSEVFKFKNIIGIRQQNRGKPSALNNCVKAATGEIVVSTDGDSYLEEEAVERIVERFLEDPEVGAVAGFITVSNEDESWLTRFSQLEYVIEQILFRGCQSFSGDVVICPGAIFAARRQLLLDHPSSNRTIVEDCDQTCLIRQAGWKVVFAPEATSKTRAPATLRGWINQRLRWLYGYLQVWYLMRRFALKKPWMFYGYLGYPMIFATFPALLVPFALVWLFPSPYLFRDILIYTGLGVAFTLAVNLYSIFLLAPQDVKKGTLLWLLLFPVYEIMVMITRAYLYIFYIRGDGPTMKYGPRTIHALPDRSVFVEDSVVPKDSTALQTKETMDLVEYLTDRKLCEDQRRGIIRGLPDSDKAILKRLLDLLLCSNEKDLSKDKKLEIYDNLSSAQVVALKDLVAGVVNETAALQIQDAT